MKERDERLVAVVQQLGDAPVVEVEAGLIHGPLAVGQDAAPGDAEAIRLHAQLAHERHITCVAPVVITRDIAGVTSGYQAGRVHEALPDAGAGSVSQRRALDLIGRGGTTPEETAWKLDGLCHVRFKNGG